MAEANATPFTNTRLMVAGIVLGVLGAVLAWLYIRGRVQSETGGTITVYSMAKDLKVNEKLTSGHVKPITLPGIYARNVPKHIKDYELSNVLGKNPVRNMMEGEPVVSTDFQFTTQEITVPPVPRGKVRIPIRVDPRSSPGEQLRVGDTVNLLGNFNFGAGRTEDKLDIRQVRLTAVQVIAINGSGRPTPKDLDQITSINVDIGAVTSEFLKKLEPRKMGDFTIEILPESVRPSATDEELSPECKALIIEKLGPLGAAGK